MQSLGVMKEQVKRLKLERANAMIEYIIIMPVIFVVIYMILSMSFVMHDKGTLEGAAKRGALYAAHCISDPNYASILQQSGNKKGSLDVKKSITAFSFSKVGRDNHPYRYLKKKTPGLEADVLEQVNAILDQTRIPWKKMKIENVAFKQSNHLFYQEVEVTITASYPIARFFHNIGLQDDYEYTVTAKMSVNDPDEFIRNTDLCVDLLIKLDDNFFGGELQQGISKLGEIAEKLTSWVSLDK